ncbi:MAG: hypothetical protein U0Q47_12720 [Mycobacterium sp.]
MRCPSGKHGYPTAADSMRGCRDGYRRPYRCHTCRAWHLGRAIASLPDQEGARR